MVVGIIIPKEKLIADGFDFTICNYRANAHFSDGSILKRVSVIFNKNVFCYSISEDDKNVLVFKPEEQKKGFRLEKIYEN